MSQLYQLVPMEGKGFGIVASTFIKKGTVILKEYAQMPFLDCEPDLDTLPDFLGGGPAQEESWMNWIKKILDLFNKMTISDQKNYLELYNILEHVPEFDLSQWTERLCTDQITYEDCVKGYLEKFTEKMESDKKKAEKIFKIVGIYWSNLLKDGLKIKRARFNHSCRPNTFQHIPEHGSNEIWVVSNIQPGQEITVDYTRGKVLFNMLSKEMRKWHLKASFNVKNCFCDFCKEGETSPKPEPDKTILGSKVDKLIAELEPLVYDNMKGKLCLPYIINSNYEEPFPDFITPEKCRKHVELCKKLYKLGKERKDSKISLSTIVHLGYIAAHFGILMVWKGPKKQMAVEFKNDSIMFCKAIEIFCKFELVAKEVVTPEEWRERHQNYDKYLDDFGVKLT